MSSEGNLKEICLSFHAERLHEDDVWFRVSSLLDVLERQSWKSTFFVSPALALVDNRSLRDRLDELVARGHEIGQHTHFYDADSSSLEKQQAWPPTSQQIISALDRDYEYLRAVGVRPLGFTAGGHAIFDDTLDWLARKGFEYDCSFRAFPLPYDAPEAARGYPFHEPFRLGRLLMIPTTAPLKQALGRELLRRSGTGKYDRGSYEIYYAHDWDLRALPVRLVARLLAVKSRARSICVRNLADLIKGGSDSR